LNQYGLYGSVMLPNVDNQEERGGGLKLELLN